MDHNKIVHSVNDMSKVWELQLSMFPRQQHLCIFACISSWLYWSLVLRTLIETTHASNGYIHQQSRASDIESLWSWTNGCVSKWGCRDGKFVSGVCFAGLFRGMFRGSVSPKSNFPALLKVALPQKMQTQMWSNLYFEGYGIEEVTGATSDTVISRTKVDSKFTFSPSWWHFAHHHHPGNLCP